MRDTADGFLPTTTAPAMLPVTTESNRTERPFLFPEKGEEGLFDGLFLFFLRWRPSIPTGGGRRKKKEEEQKTLQFPSS